MGKKIDYRGGKEGNKKREKVIDSKTGKVGQKERYKVEKKG